MQIHTLDKAQLINETQLGSQLSHAVEHGRRADFALLLSMLSPDHLEHVPTDIEPEVQTGDEQLRAYFELNAPRPMTTSEHCYDNGAAQADAFHQDGLTGSRLMQELKPTALSFPPQGTKGLPEELYHNLSGHQRRQLPPSEQHKVSASPKELYTSLTTARRFAEMAIAV